MPSKLQALQALADMLPVLRHVCRRAIPEKVSWLDEPGEGACMRAWLAGCLPASLAGWLLPCWLAAKHHGSAAPRGQEADVPFAPAGGPALLQLGEQGSAFQRRLPKGTPPCSRQYTERLLRQVEALGPQGLEEQVRARGSLWASSPRPTACHGGCSGQLCALLTALPPARMPASLLAPQLNAGRFAGSPLLGLPACSGAAASGRDFAVLAAQSC